MGTKGKRGFPKVCRNTSRPLSCQCSPTPCGIYKGRVGEKGNESQFKGPILRKVKKSCNREGIKQTRIIAQEQAGSKRKISCNFFQKRVFFVVFVVKYTHTSGFVSETKSERKMICELRHALTPIQTLYKAQSLWDIYSMTAFRDFANVKLFQKAAVTVGPDSLCLRFKTCT